ncbi:MAG: alpha-amylase family glycosyl hydrolase [Ferruginibacter sp.]
MKIHPALIRITAFLLSFALLMFPCVSNAQASENKWWKESVFYEIYMPSYADSNGDGYGDFKGMTSKLDYLQSLGIKALWLTPFLQSPKVDNGYDVTSYYDIDATYGSTEDFKSFLAAAHKRNIKVIMDMVLNHTSTEAKWFRESRKSLDNSYRDYYIWKDKANNWESFFGGSAWEMDSVTNQYYYHKFDKRMADLNWANPKLVQDVQTMLRYWLNLGVDGFRLDVINFLNTDGIIHDNPMRNGVQQHFYDINQKGVKDVMKKIKAVVGEYKDRFVVGEIGSDKIDVLTQYDLPELLDAVFNFNFGSMASFSGKRIYDELISMGVNMRSFPTLFFGSHDMPRLMDRLANGDTSRARALAALMLTAKGIPFIYYGDEIGMHNITAQRVEEIVDIQGRTHYQIAVSNGKNAEAALKEANENNRDKSRSPMQWNGNAFAGFSTTKSWIKIGQDYKEVNVQALTTKPNSILSFYKELLALRNREKVLQYGSYDKLEYAQDQIFFTRYFGVDKISVIINFGSTKTATLPAGAKILMGSTDLKPNSFLIYRN